MLSEEYNIIPIGDHCVCANALKNLGIRKCSYPFDWVTMNQPSRNTNIYYNIELFNRMNENNIQQIVQEFLGDAFQNKYNINLRTQVWFPHDNNNNNDLFSKYERRFQRLYCDLTNQKNIFLLISRNHPISEDFLDKMIDILMKFHPQNKILFICGVDHPYFSSNIEKYRDKVIFKNIYFDMQKGFDYDVEFNKNIQTYLRELLL